MNINAIIVKGYKDIRYHVESLKGHGYDREERRSTITQRNKNALVLNSVFYSCVPLMSLAPLSLYLFQDALSLKEMGVACFFGGLGINGLAYTHTKLRRGRIRQNNAIEAGYHQYNLVRGKEIPKEIYNGEDGGLGLDTVDLP